LIAFIMDMSPPEEDDKKGKKPVEKGTSRTGKKGKGEDGEWPLLITVNTKFKGVRVFMLVMTMTTECDLVLY